MLKEYPTLPKPTAELKADGLYLVNGSMTLNVRVKENNIWLTKPYKIEPRLHWAPTGTECSLSSPRIPKHGKLRVSKTMDIDICSFYGGIKNSPVLKLKMDRF